MNKEDEEDSLSFRRDTRSVGVENMISMDDLTETTLLNNIHVRYNNDMIYVRTLVLNFF